MADDSARILANLKASLRTRSITYASLAKRIGLSEASVKRVLSRGTLSLRRLDQICEAIGSSLPELVQLTQPSAPERPDLLTLEQEKALAADPKLFACYHLVANGRSNREIEADMRATQRAVLHWIAGLKALGLVHSSKARAGATAIAAVRWRPDGPIRRMYEREVRKEFLQSLFGAEREALHFSSAELSAASCRILQRKLDRLAADFRDLADLDSTLPSREKRNVGCLLAMRPWVFSRFAPPPH
ncbi:MAG: helix-turn-helix transcriptional regulator [Pseudomonadota bacterium]